MAKLMIINSNIFIENLMNFLPTSVHEKKFSLKSKSEMTTFNDLSNVKISLNIEAVK